MLLATTGYASAATRTNLLASSLWDVDMGVRFWLSSGSDGAPNPLMNIPPEPAALASRLVFEGLDGYTGEVFARADRIDGWFVKGFLGAGGITSGALYDEDFPAGPVYSRTLSDTTGYLSYLNLDIGHNLLQSEEGRVGAFFGYNYYAQHLVATGCTQVAGSTVCTGQAFPSNYPGITQDDRYDSLRMGITTQVALSNRLHLSTESAYIPVVGLNGMDNHNARELIGPERASVGDGMMLEAILKYKLSDYWDIGIGGRYWVWNMRDGMVDFDFLNVPGTTVIQEPSRFTMERYGVFVEGEYHWNNKTKPRAMTTTPVNWSGLSIGGYLGGGWGDDNWSDPFGPTTNGAYTNVAGVGDSTHATGPLGGIDVDYSWQKNSWVYGIGADANTANIRGEYTCFSGLGGVNCQRVVNTFGALTARLGYAWSRSLIYARGGRAWTNTTYSLNANTSALSLGAEDTQANVWGWTLGIGVENAITENWIATFEYDFIEVPDETVSFPNVSTVNTQTINVHQSLNLAKIGLKYKF